ncbi:MAG: coproporphyrinogen III oxidase family protein [Campylobacterales bacterium]|nr:coproporphyrinogen III oxidase family protein [Campylobacterales bacterium]
MLLYLHIPYCDSKCHYCSFNSYTHKHNTQNRYMQSICVQLQYELERFKPSRGDIKNIFIGGGTPSTINPSHYQDFFSIIKPYIDPDAEITAEANPNSSTVLWMKGMKDLGVNRLSFGVQSFDDAKLHNLGRAHDRIQAIDAITNAHTLGFEHISLDLIYNARGDTKELLKKDIDTAFSLPIDHISAYELTIEDKTNFTDKDRQTDDSLAFFVAEEIIKKGFEHYEISNFGTYQSKHNKGYWNLENYIGIGAGAVGFLDDTRLYPLTDIDGYITNPLHIKKERLTSKDILTEKIFLGLRSTIGIEISILPIHILQKADFLTNSGKLTKSATHYYNLDLFLSDEIALYLMD